MAAPARVGSRIRRDPPPPPPRRVTARQIREREAKMVVIGILVFALALTVLMVALGQGAGWSPADYVIAIQDDR